MKQVLLSKRTGAVRVADVPAPSGAAGGVLIRTRASLISSGTERSAMASGAMSLVERARRRPDLVRKVVALGRERGWLEAYRTVRDKLDEESPMGYSLAGEVVDGAAAGLAAGTRVAAVGGGFAVHAELVEVPAGLVTPLPDGVGFDEGAFTALGAIAMHGIRLAGVELGDHVVVIGLGLLGLLTTQLLRAAGCVVYGYDLAPARAELARELGASIATIDATGLERAVFDGTRTRGADAVLITAGTSSNAPIELAPRVSRDRAAVIVVGDVGLQLPREPYFAGELSVRISRSYGPGRYDEDYEVRGRGYPAGYVRWTERRNCAEFLRLVDTGAVRLSPLITRHFPVEEAAAAYATIQPGGGSVATLLHYPDRTGADERATEIPARVVRRSRSGALRLGVIGAGDFARGVLLPRLRMRGDVELVSVAATTPASANRAATQFGFHRAATDPAAIIDADDIDAVLVLSRHDSHARYALAALRAHKPVFVEKPVAITREQLTELDQAMRDPSALLQVGFNRRFSPLGKRFREFLGGSPLHLLYRVNAGYLPPSHWTRRRDVGGGRIIGEVCHFVDFVGFAMGRTARRVEVSGIPAEDGGPVDNISILLDFGPAGVATISYVTAAPTSLPKERIEGFSTGRSAVLDDYRSLELWSRGRTERIGGRAQDKGFDAELDAFVRACRGEGERAMTWQEIHDVTRVTLDVTERLSGSVEVPTDGDSPLTSFAQPSVS